MTDAMWGYAIGGGVAAVLLLAALGWVLARRRPVRIASPEEAAEAAEAALPGFDTQGAVVGADGGGALAVDRAGRVAVMRRQGAGIVVREVAWGALRSTAEGILIDSGERRLGPVLVAGVDALDVRRLAPADLKRLVPEMGR
ncbi:hypothetical protein M9979_04370 [Sphingomonas sp. RP10(2022)]|uniref:Uncharacterized protein n=1 Tax=Sphingomonas liriopis TaxID=2949094 RepID=A0A9X2KPN4_9SPHN|nr:hypothetical protein [Sphingomonas liriopis]MCP3734110.1 hypothetical protein [Sphingomonas liriopis]